MFGFYLFLLFLLVLLGCCGCVGCCVWVWVIGGFVWVLCELRVWFWVLGLYVVFVGGVVCDWLVLLFVFIV